MIKEKINSIIMTLFVFQFGFLQPVASIIGSQKPIIFFTLFLLMSSLINNKFIVKKHVIYTLVITTIFFGTHIILFPKNKVINIYIEFLIKGYSAYILGSLSTNGDNLYKAFKNIAVFNFLTIFLYPFTDFFDSMNYMRFGYAMIPSSLMFINVYSNTLKNKWKWGVLTFISIILSVVFGSRGSLVVLIVYGVMLFILSNRIKTRFKRILGLFLIIFSYLIISYNVIGKLLGFLYINMNIKSYSIMKLYRMFNDDLLGALSGRDRIYFETIKYIRQNVIFGNGIGFSRTISGSSTHNFILQILSETGIFGFIFWILLINYLFKCLILIRDYDFKYYSIVLIVSSLSIGRLLFSSDIWLRPELWFSISIILSYSYKLGEKYR